MKDDHLLSPSPVGLMPDALFLAEAILFPRPATDRMTAENSSSPQNPVENFKMINSL